MSIRKVKVAHTRLPSVGFRSWSRFSAISLQVMWVINPTIGCHYFPPGLQLPSQPLRGLLPLLLFGEQQHDGCEQFVTTREMRSSAELDFSVCVSPALTQCRRPRFTSSRRHYWCPRQINKQSHRPALDSKLSFPREAHTAILLAFCVCDGQDMAIKRISFIKAIIV